GDRGERNREPGFAEIGAHPESNEWGQFMLRRISYPFPFRHGRYALEELLDSADRLHPVAFRQNRGGEPFGPQQLLFLDTETTGLG
ncbi:hypothetical protein NL460_28885, partial [Klebsiella pneumoniae]|nr:hypothetical protein [Klebsiella pneumoniae]